MKKFTIISLMLVLVASFVFAAGLTPYVTASNAVKATGVSVALEEDDVDADFITSLKFDGSFKAGVKDAAGIVDVNANFDVDYYRTIDGLKSLEAEARYFVLSDVTTWAAYDKATRYSGKLDDLLVFVPSINAEYYNDNLKANANITFTTSKSADSIYDMFLSLKSHGIQCASENKDHGKRYEVDESLNVSLSADYATVLKNSENIVKGSAKESLTFDDKEVTSSTTAEVDFYVPTATTTTKAVMGKNFDSITKNYVFKAFANVNFGFDAADGKVDANSWNNNATFGIDYFKYLKGGYANISGTFKGVSTAKDIIYYTSSVNAVYDYEEVKGENAKDVFAVLAKAGVTNTGYKTATCKTASISASAQVSIPRLIPVELIDNMSFNLPMDFVAAYAESFKNGEADETSLSFDVTAYPVYIEFEEGAYVLFGKALKSLTVSTSYGNEAVYGGTIKDFTEKTNRFNFAVGTSLALDGATFALDYAAKEVVKGDNLSNRGYTPEADDIVGLVTLSYSVNY